jgi:hypothetical protein
VLSIFLQAEIFGVTRSLSQILTVCQSNFKIFSIRAYLVEQDCLVLVRPEPESQITRVPAWQLQWRGFFTKGQCILKLINWKRLNKIKIDEN